MDSYEKQLEKQNEELRERLERAIMLEDILPILMRGVAYRSTNDERLREHGVTWNQLCDIAGLENCKINSPNDLKCPQCGTLIDLYKSKCSCGWQRKFR